ncbi:DHA1 family bicyclomycin/chloramphenicol resistance-like MFS transporter [Robbsia andropogonis]|uniref:multidrug effflux MFS transporter n=1 Tax=Robbsia andropogonis TaxID=28092 RepID=UPI003D18FD9B
MNVSDGKPGTRSTDIAAPLRSTVPKAPLWLLVMITISGTLAMHIFVPALPDAAHAFGVGPAAMQATISVYIIGLAFGQLVYGPLSDGLGRRPMLLFGLALYGVASAIAMCATSVHVLIVARLFQALGGCAGLALGRAIVRDTSASDEAVRALALMNLMMMVGPGFAPLAAWGLVSIGGWRLVFVVLTVLGTATLFLTWRMIPETGSPSGNVSAAKLLRDYGTLLRVPAFLGYAIGGGCATTSIYGYIAAAPFIVMQVLHRPLGEVGIYLGLLIVGMSIGNATTRRLIRGVSLTRLLIAGNIVSLASAVALLLIVLADTLTVSSAVGCTFLFALGAGLSSPAALSKALAVDNRLTGSAAGLYGFTQMAVGSLCTTLTSLGGHPALAAAVVLTGAALIAQGGFICALRYERRNAA